MSNILLLNYNNYFNRIVKIENSIKDYLKYQVGSWQVNINFKPADGINTNLVLNIKEIDNPDYLIVVNDNSELCSRWFVLEKTRIREGQSRLILRRDVLADKFKELLLADAFIEKGYVHKTNPLIFNLEGSQFNQIKQKEIPLFDNTKTPWIIGYMDHKYMSSVADAFKDWASIPWNTGIPTDKTFTGSVTQAQVKDLSQFVFFNDIKDNLPTGAEPLLKTVSSEAIDGYYEFWVGSYEKISTRWNTFSQNIQLKKDGTKRISGVNHNPATNDDEFEIYKNKTFIVNNSGGVGEFQVRVISDNLKTYNLEVPKFNPSGVVIDDVNRFKKEDNQTYISNGLYYNIHTTSILIKDNNVPLDRPGLKQQLISFANENNYETPFIESYTKFQAHFTTNEIKYEVRLVSEAIENYEVTMSATSNILIDAPYQMFAIPLGFNNETSVSVKIGSETFTLNPKLNFALAENIVTNLQPTQAGKGFLYDIQILPYCPFTEWFTFSDNTMILNSEANKPKINYDLVKSAGETVGVIFYPVLSRFTNNIAVDFNFNQLNDLEYKVEHETTRYRICSPNGANFESFDPFINNGVDYVNVDCTYKPQTPYIKLNINYKGLYGKDFNDFRGLICSGDFGFPLMSDAWEQYQIGNKNYANIFEREQRHIATHDALNVAKLGAAIVGASRGSSPQTGIGIGTAAASAIIDIAEGRDYRKDIYNFNLQNVQALPNGLVRTSSFNYNYKLFPIIEFYDCTQIEKLALTNQIKFGGMSIGIVSKIINYLQINIPTFIKAKIIRFTDNFTEDLHFASIIANELASGVFITLKGENK